MRRALRLLTITLLWAALPLLAAAQGQDPLQRHTAALQNLSRSVELLASDSTASLDALESAASSMRLLAADVTSTSLEPAMEQLFDSARQAIANRSGTDLAVQAAVLRGGFQRALLEGSLVSGDLEQARDGLNHLAAEQNLDVQALDGMGQATDLPQLLARYRAGVARSMADRLAIVREQFPEAREDAYVTLAGAYGLSLAIQDAPDTPSGLNANLGDLIGAVVASDGETVESLAAALQEQLAQLGEGPATAPAVSPEPGPEAPEAEAAPADPAQSEVPAPVDDTQEAGAAAAADATAEEAAEPVAAPLEADAPPALASLFDLQQDDEEETDEVFDALTVDLARRGLRGQAGETLARQLQDRGYTSIAQVLNETVALATRAGNAAMTGDQSASRQYLNQLDSTYDGVLAPLSSRSDPALHNSIDLLIGQLLDSPAVHASEVQALAGLLTGVASVGGGNNGQQTLQAESAGWTSGWPRMALLIVTALLAILPLVYLRLAFGGGNRNWSMIGAGLFLLLLPVILGGIGALLELVGHFAALPVLFDVAAWLTPAGVLQQVLSVVLALLAIVLLAIGFQGICRQFGLFGGQGGGRARFGKRNGEKPTNKTLVDWDEDF